MLYNFNLLNNVYNFFFFFLIISFQYVKHLHLFQYAKYFNIAARDMSHPKRIIANNIVRRVNEQLNSSVSCIALKNSEVNRCKSFSIKSNTEQRLKIFFLLKPSSFYYPNIMIILFVMIVITIVLTLYDCMSFMKNYSCYTNICIYFRCQNFQFTYHLGEV